MRFYVGGPRIFGLRTGVILGLQDLWYSPPRTAAGVVNYVYVIQGEHGAVKVGITTCPEARIAQLRTGSHVDLSFVALAACSGSPYRVERYAHQILRNHRLAGEWFDVAPEIAVEAINRAATACGQTLAPADPSRPLKPAILSLSPAEARRGNQNMAIVACALVAGLCTAILVAYLMMTIKVAASSHPDEVRTYANATAVATFAEKECQDLQANTSALVALRIGMHIQDADSDLVALIGGATQKGLSEAVEKAPTHKSWCDNAYSLFGPDGSVIPNLVLPK